MTAGGEHGQASGALRMSVIITSWNACEVLERCLASLERQVVAGGFETIVVDNVSTDGTAELLRRYEPRVRVIYNERNEGYGLGNNRGASVARGRTLFFLNPDTELLAPDVLERLALAVEAPRVGLAGPRLVNPDGSLQPSCAAHPSIARALAIAIGLPRLVPEGPRGRIDPERWSHDRSRDVDWVKGAALAVRADLFRELGGFWSSLYAEEQDLAYRAAQRGFRVRFERSADVMHVGRFSLSQRLTAPQRAAQVARAELAFLRSHYGRRRAAAIRTIVLAGYMARAVAHTALGRRSRAAIFRAMARIYLPVALDVRARTGSGRP